MKKLMILLFAAALLFSAAVVCAQSPADQADLKALDASLTQDIHIEVWGKDSVNPDSPTSRGQLFTEIAEKFSSQFDHVTVEYIYQGSYDETRSKVVAASVAGNLPGIWMAEESTVKGFAEIAADMKQWIPSATIDDYLDGLLSVSLYDGDRMIGAPAARSLPVLYVNNEVLAAAGWTGDMIKTNDDMFQCAKDIYEKTGKPGMAIWWDTDLWHWESAVYADGGQILTDDGQHPAFGKDYDYVGAKYVLRVQEGLKEGYIKSNYSEPKVNDANGLDLATGEIGILLTSCNSMPKRFNAAKENGHTLSTYVQPAGEGGISVTGGGSCWVMADGKSETEKLFAGAFLAFVASPENVLENTNRTGSFMITESALNSEEGKQMLVDHPEFQAIYDTIPYLHARPNTPYWAEMYTYGADKLAQFTLNYETTDVYAMIDEMEAKFQQIIDDNAW